MKQELADYLNKETEKLKAQQRLERAPAIKLPAGHKWEQVPHAPSAETWFQCKKCAATFIHDMIDDSIEQEDGDGKCDK